MTDARGPVHFAVIPMGGPSHGRSHQTHHGRTYSPGYPLAPWLPPPPPLYPQSHLQSPWSSHTLPLPPRTRDTQASTVTPPRRKSCSMVGIPAWHLSPPQRCPFSRIHVCAPLESSTDRHATACVPLQVSLVWNGSPLSPRLSHPRVSSVAKTLKKNLPEPY